MAEKTVRVWSREELLNSGLTGRQSHRYFIGRDTVSGYALIDGNFMEDIYARLNCSRERYVEVFEYRF